MILRGKVLVLLLALLLLSLGLNLFGAGLWLGQGLGRSERAMSAGAQRLAAGLPPADARIVRDTFHERRDQLGRALGQLREARRAVFEQLRAPVLDRPGLDAALARLRAQSGEVQAILHAAVAEAAAAMPASARSQWRPPLRGN